MTTDDKVTILCPDTGNMVRVSPQAAEVAREMEGLPHEDQRRMLVMFRMMAAKAWPHDLEEMKSWTPEQFRAAVDSLPAGQ